MTRVAFVLAALALLVVVRGEGQTCSANIPAGNCTASTTTTMTAGAVLQLTLSATATVLTAPATSDYDAGYVANTGPSTTIKCNRTWTLQIAAAAATWSATSTQAGVTARANKPAGDLQWSTAAGGPFGSVALAGATAASGTATAATVTNVYFRTLYSWSVDTPGSYSLALVYTLSAP